MMRPENPPGSGVVRSSIQPPPASPYTAVEETKSTRRTAAPDASTASSTLRQPVHVRGAVGTFGGGVRGYGDDDGGGVRRDGRQFAGAQVSRDAFDGGRKFLRRAPPAHHPVAGRGESQPGFGAQIAATGQQYSHEASLPALRKRRGQA